MALLPFRAGIHATDPQKKGFLNLALGESPYGMSPAARGTVQQSALKNLPYPDSSCEELREKIATHYGTLPEMVFVGNGIDELILISALTFLKPHDTCLLNRSTFAGFEAAAELAHANKLFAPLHDGLRIDEELMAAYLQKKPTLWFLCNPHNPTGTVVPLSKLLDIAEKNGVIVVIDEAYAEYAGEFESAIPNIHRYPNVLVMRTFSKIYGMAGLRCGYAMGNPHLIDSLKKTKHVLPFSVNRLALEVASIAIVDQNFVRENFHKTEVVKHFFYSQLRRMGLSFIPSSTNFVLVQLDRETETFCQEMREKHNILIRSGSAFDLPHHIRITLGTIHQMKRLTEILNKEFYGPVRSAL